MNLANIFKFVESRLGVKSKLFIGSSVLLLSAFGLHALMPKQNDVVAGSVMITNMAGTSGGTGVILKSSSTRTEIITNSHVCRGVEQGGVVKTKQGSYMVITYKHSKFHDICQIIINGDLNYNTEVAKKAPISYYEKAMISGHPALLPNVVTSGHFSGQKIISVMSGIKPCTDSDKEDPNLGLLCILAGGIPVVKQYESVLVTATIMPGSSGSGVYNENKELVGLAFAGSGDLGYAWTVPFEALRKFLDEERHSLEDLQPSGELYLDQSSRNQTKISETDAIKNIKKECRGENREKLGVYCTLAEQDIIWRQ